MSESATPTDGSYHPPKQFAVRRELRELAKATTHRRVTPSAPSSSLYEELESAHRNLAFHQPALTPQEAMGRIIKEGYLLPDEANNVWLKVDSDASAFKRLLRDNKIYLAFDPFNDNVCKVRRSDVELLIRDKPELFRDILYPAFDPDGSRSRRLNPQEVINRLLAKSHLAIYPQPLLVVKTVAMKEAVEALGINPPYNRDYHYDWEGFSGTKHLYAVAKDDITRALAEHPHAFNQLLRYSQSVRNTHSDESILEALQREKHIAAERMLSVRSSLDPAIAALGVETSRRKGGYNLVHESVLAWSHISNSRPLEELVITPPPFTPLDVVGALAARKCFRQQNDGASRSLLLHESGDISVATIEATLERAGIAIDRNYRMPRVTEASLLAAAKGDKAALAKIYAEAPHLQQREKLVLKSAASASPTPEAIFGNLFNNGFIDCEKLGKETRCNFTVKGRKSTGLYDAIKKLLPEKLKWNSDRRSYSFLKEDLIEALTHKPDALSAYVTLGSSR